MSRKMIVALSAMALIVAPLLIAQPSVEDEMQLKRASNETQVKLDPSTPKVRVLDTPVTATRNGVDKNVPAGIIYDDGIVTAVPAASSNCFGNQFDTANGTATVKSFSVSRMSFFIVSGAGSDNVFLSVFGPVTGTAAPVLTSTSVPLNNGSSAFNTHTFGTPITGTGSFLAGVWYIGGDTVGLGSGTVGGQGHHGMLINDVAGTGFSTLPGLNALVGASTAFLPVELMSFSISDE